MGDVLRLEWLQAQPKWKFHLKRSMLSTAPADVLSSYPAILLVGDVTFEPDFVGRLLAALKAGSQLLLHERHAQTLGSNLARLQDAGHVEILEPWTNPATGRPAAVSNDRLAKLAAEYLPVAVEGDPVQYQINRTDRSWVIELVHNGGVSKKPDRPAIVDAQNVARVTLTSRFPLRAATEWRSGRIFPANLPLTIEIPPGQTMFAELVPQE